MNYFKSLKVRAELDPKHTTIREGFFATGLTGVGILDIAQGKPLLMGLGAATLLVPLSHCIPETVYAARKWRENVKLARRA